MMSNRKSYDEILRWFAYGHLPEYLQRVSAPCGRLAEKMADMLPCHPEIQEGLRKLLEAKDCFVRAAIDKVATQTDGEEE